MRWWTALVLVACVDPRTGRDLTSTFEAIVRTRATQEFPCSGEIVIQDLGGDAYRAHGCGFHATYECIADINSGDSKTEWRYECKRAVADDPAPDPPDTGGD